jgi:urease gamma subunit
MPHKKRDRPRSKIVLAMAAEIRRLRKDRGWKLKHLAEASGLTIGFLSEAETGRCDPSENRHGRPERPNAAGSSTGNELK